MYFLSLYLMATLYTAAGVLHFVKPGTYLKIMPPYIPAPLAMVYISGVAEIVLGLALFFPATRMYAAWGVIALLVAVLPANIYMYQMGSAFFGIAYWILLMRLPLQFVLMAWAYVYTR